MAIYSGNWTGHFGFQQETARSIPPSCLTRSNSGFRLYAGIIKIGARHGHPILSLTAGHENHVVGAPSDAYVKTIVCGLNETYPCMRKTKILAYLSGTEGIRKAIPEDTLARWVSRP